jgi:hypothetical protein
MDMKNTEATKGTEMTDCKSKTHKAYAGAVEGARIQAYLVERDLQDARVGEGSRVIDWPYVFSKARERMNFAEDELQRATRAVNAHFDRGCANLAILTA